MPINLVSIVGFVLIFGFLIFVHELGHLLAAKAVGVKVEEFSLGFPLPSLGRRKARKPAADREYFHAPPETQKAVSARSLPPGEEPETREATVWEPRTAPSLRLFNWGETRFVLNWLPLGGYVKPIGEDNPDVPGGLAAAPKGARLAVLSAGSLANLFTAVLVFSVGYKTGWPAPDQVAITAIAVGSPAQAAGIRPGDVFVTADGEAIHEPEQVTEIVHSRLGQPLTLALRREGETLTFSVTPRTEWPEDQGPMGIVMGWSFVGQGAWVEALRRGASETGYQILELFLLPGRIARGEIPAELARPIGPVGLYQVSNSQFELARDINSPFPVIYLLGVVSVALGLTNLLPIPALDGGRILFVLLELVRGRRLNPEREAFIHVVGMALLLALMAMITYQDFVNPIVPR